MAVWHVRIADADPVGPISTDLVVRGIVAGKVPTNALARRDDDTTWIAIGRISEFREAVRHAPPQSSPLAPESTPMPSSGPTSTPMGRQPNEVLVARRAADRQPLGPLERRVVAMLDGRRSIQEVAALVGLTTRETVSVCEFLVALGVAAFTTASQEPAIEVSFDEASEDPHDELDAGWDAAPAPKNPR